MEDRKDKFYDALEIVREEYENSINLGRTEKVLSENGGKVDPRYIGVPNINFSCNYKEKDEERYSSQRITNGFDDSETWNLNTTIAKFIIPRLKRFMETTNAHPAGLRAEEWDDVLHKILSAFEAYLKLDDVVGDGIKAETDKVKAGLDLFAKYFFNLWW